MHICSLWTPTGSRVLTYAPFWHQPCPESSHMFLFYINWVPNSHVVFLALTGSRILMYVPFWHHLCPESWRMFLFDINWVSNPHLCYFLTTGFRILIYVTFWHQLGHFLTPTGSGILTYVPCNTNWVSQSSRMFNFDTNVFRVLMFLKHKFPLNNIHKFGFFPTRNTIHIHTKTNRLVLFRDVIGVRSENYTKPVNKLCGQYARSLSIQ
jgi:hypothetical protein